MPYADVFSDGLDAASLARMALGADGAESSGGEIAETALDLLATPTPASPATGGPLDALGSFAAAPAPNAIENDFFGGPSSDTMAPTLVANVPADIRTQMHRTGEASTLQRRPWSPIPRWVGTAARAGAAGLGLLGAAYACVAIPFHGTTLASIAWENARAAGQTVGLLGGPDLVAHHVRGTLWTLADGHVALIVMGEVENRGERTPGTVMVRAQLRDLRGQPVREAAAPAGYVFSELEVTGMTAAQWQSGDFARGPAANLAPGIRLPFMLLVLDPPAGIEDGALSVSVEELAPAKAARVTDPGSFKHHPHGAARAALGV
jgi:hypothetical protein